jgi:hypothetical protein
MSFGLSLSSMAFLQISRFLRRSLFGDLLEVGVLGFGSPAGQCRARARSRSVGVPEPAEYATLSREHEDYLRAQVAHR